jgi:hypothetical protein
VSRIGCPLGATLTDRLREANIAIPLPAPTRPAHTPTMFIVSEAEAAAIRTAFDQEGELSAAIELRRLFPGITDNAKARECVRAITGWQPLPVKPLRSGTVPGRRRSIPR